MQHLYSTYRILTIGKTWIIYRDVFTSLIDMDALACDGQSLFEVEKLWPGLVQI